MLIVRLFYLKYLRKNPNSKRSWRKRPACAFRIIIFLIGKNPARAECLCLSNNNILIVKRLARAERLCLSNNTIFNSKEVYASAPLVPYASNPRHRHSITL